MNEDKLTIWCNNDFTSDQTVQRDHLVKGVGDHQLLMFEPDQDGRNGQSRFALESADIAFGYPDVQAVVDCKKIRWVHLNAAGYTSFDRDEIKKALSIRRVMLTNSSAVYDEPCAQHLLAMILSLARGLPLALDEQRGARSWQMSVMRPSLRLLNGQTVLLLGYGAIARRLVELLHPLEMNLIAVRRVINRDESIRVTTVTSVDEFLPIADHVVNILPANEETHWFLNSTRLGSLKPGAFVYNIGRGVTVDQAALIKELHSGRIAAAYLDVTDPEPLPPEHPLWTTPRCYITPHTGGGYDREKERQVKHFLDNLHRFEGGERLVNRLM
jgi:phosphoglycerate dehydrogenase-like enzyme